MVLLGAPAPALIWASSGAGLYAICVVRGVGFAIFTIAGTVSTGEIAPPGRHGEIAGLYGLAAAIPNVVLVPVSVLLLHDVGFWPVAVLAALPVPGALFGIGAGWREGAGSAAAAAGVGGCLAGVGRCDRGPAGARARGGAVCADDRRRRGRDDPADRAQRARRDRRPGVVRGDGRGGPLAGGRPRCVATASACCSQAPA